MRMLNKEVILKQFDELPPELMQEVLNFIEQNLLLIQQENLRKIWDSEDEDLYRI